MEFEAKISLRHNVASESGVSQQKQLAALQLSQFKSDVQLGASEAALNGIKLFSRFRIGSLLELGCFSVVESDICRLSNTRHMFQNL
jgi:hypothetical protein